MNLKIEPLIIKFCQLPTKLQAAQKKFISEFTLGLFFALDCKYLHIIESYHIEQWEDLCKDNISGTNFWKIFMHLILGYFCGGASSQFFHVFQPLMLLQELLK